MSPQDREPIVIACAADDRYVQPLGVMLQSALANLRPHRSLDVYVLDGGIAASHRRDLSRSWDPARAAVRFLAPQPGTLSGLPLWGRMPEATYYKLLAPALLPSEVPKAIWLDSDLVVTGDLARLWETDLAGRHALAVQDHGVPLVSSPNGVSAHRQLGLAPDAKYFNAGVMVLNLELWRRDDVAGLAMDYLRRHRDRVVFLDQEALNVVLSGKWGELDRRWNCIANPRGAGARAIDPWIHHFTGNLKPWAYPGSEPSHVLYFTYLDQTAWAGWRPGRSLTRIMLGSYQSSALRRMLYPAEEGLMRLLRTFTRRDACNPRSR